MTIEDLKANNCIVLEALSGSRAYGLATPQSDTDIKGVFVLPRQQFFGLTYVPQVANETNDIVYYELGRFVELLAKNNPNILELLATPEDSLRHRHPIMERLKPELFLSKLCRQSFATYAMTQVRKARGLNKKILNPMKKERKSVLEFCYVAVGQGSVPLVEWLHEKGIRQQDCGLVNIAHMNDVYALFYNPTVQYKGIMRKDESLDVALSSVPKEEEPIAMMSYNRNGFSVYCKEYKAYWDWVDKRNDVRYQNTLTHGKNYDAKNMMHTFRLLAMAEEIATQGRINVRRPDREFLLKVKAGAFEYDELVQEAEARAAAIDELYAKSDLPEMPDLQQVERLLVELREEWYG